ncbi:SUN domain-containing protein 2-like isoform X2 [Watersipora subatra]|uniref:SUN domain-containing protein 2-like isoform X2 n=1 Tax=Watersipora subatra TaxID=2589382 RepID=UPI00355C53AF
MSRRSSTRTTVITSSLQPRNEVNIDVSLLREDDFENVTYSNKYVDGQVISPNLSRRKLYVTEGPREQQAASLVTSGAAPSRIRVYGKSRKNDGEIRRTVIEDTSLHNSNIVIDESHVETTTAAQGAIYSSNIGSRQASQLHGAALQLEQSNNNNSAYKEAETVFSEDESMSRSTSRRKKTVRSRSRSPRRGARVSGKRRSSARQEEIDSESSSSLEIASKGRGGDEKRGASYVLSTGLDSDTQSDLVTERSSTTIDTVATGTPFTAKLMGCVLFIYGFIRILISRIWYNFGHPVYATLQRYLLLDSWLLSRAFVRQLRGLLAGLLLLLLPLTLLFGGVCSLHAMGFLNVQMCAPITNVYYVNKQSDVNTAGFSAKLQDMLHGVFSVESKPSAVPRNRPGPAPHQIDFESMLDARIAILKSTIELQSNAEISVQKQKNTELETSIAVLTREVEEFKGKLSTLTSILADLAALKMEVAALGDKVAAFPDHRDDIARLHRDIKGLLANLGNVDIPEDKKSPGILVYLSNEISALNAAINKRQTAAAVPKDCPDSRCVCEGDLGQRLKALHEELMLAIDEKGVGAKVFVSSDNSSGISEQLVKEMILYELDVFASDRTGMPDFALQSMGAQVVSTRCSQTYYEPHGLMTYFGMPLWHLHKDPSIVIQPGVNPGECWCFHGHSGSLVIEMADKVKFNSFSLEHISAKQAATGEILSAPKDIEVYGLRSELDTEGPRLGSWRYQANGPRLQFFPVSDMGIPPYHVVELRVLSNWGQKEFTCLYRFRVHGKLAPKP